MKYYSSDSLEKSVLGALSFERITELVETIVWAVSHARRRGVLHRDLKPSNILLDEDGQPDVADLGLASLHDQNSSDTYTKCIFGTPAYMAPEQASSPAEVTTSADAYGLGAILYQLLTGRPPFQRNTSLSILNQVKLNAPTNPRVIRRSIPYDLVRVCLKCLNKNPVRRHTSAAVLADYLKRWRTGQPMTSRQESAHGL
jgi:serine/threonine-protein kinase